MWTIPDEFIAKLLRMQEIIIGTNYHRIFILADFIEPNLIYNSIRKAWDFAEEITLTESAYETVYCYTIICI